MWREAVEQVANMMAMDPYPGFEGKYFSMPARNVVPKPVQKPHPPIWVACSNRDTIHLAAQLGIGALTFAFIDPAEAQHWVDDYYETFKRECVPIGHAVNPNIAMVIELLLPPGRRTRRCAAAPTASASSSSRSATHYGFGKHTPGPHQHLGAVRGGARRARHSRCSAAAPAASARPKQLREHLRTFADAGVDQTVFIQQGGNNRHEHICEDRSSCSPSEVMPEFKAEEAARARRKDGGARALHRGGDEAQGVDGGTEGRRDRRRSNRTVTTSPKSIVSNLPEASEASDGADAQDARDRRALRRARGGEGRRS